MLSDVEVLLPLGGCYGCMTTAVTSLVPTPTSHLHPSPPPPPHTPPPTPTSRSVYTCMHGCVQLYNTSVQCLQTITEAPTRTVFTQLLSFSILSGIVCRPRWLTMKNYWWSMTNWHHDTSSCSLRVKRQRTPYSVRSGPTRLATPLRGRSSQRWFLNWGKRWRTSPTPSRASSTACKKTTTRWGRWALRFCCCLFPVCAPTKWSLTEVCFRNEAFTRVALLWFLAPPF